MLVNFAYLYLSTALRIALARSIRSTRAFFLAKWRLGICLLCIISLLAPSLLFCIETVRAYRIPNEDVDNEIQLNDGTYIGESESVEYHPSDLPQPVYRYAEDSAPSLQSQQPTQFQFIENVGQFDSKVKYKLQGSDGAVFLTEDAIWVKLLEEKEPEQMDFAVRQEQPQNITRQGVNLKISFPGANRPSVIEGIDSLDVQLSYFFGNDPDNWQSGVPVWGGVRYKDIYPGVDLEISSVDGEWDWRFVTDEAGKLAVSQLSIEGAESIAFPNGSGVIQVKTGFGMSIFPGFRVVDRFGKDLDLSALQSSEIHNNIIDRPFRAPSVPQGGGAGPGGKQNSLVQELPLDADGNLIMAFSTLLGGLGLENPPHLSIDQFGYTYIAMATDSSELEEIPGDIQLGHDSDDVYVAKFNHDGSDLLYAIYLGSQHRDYAEDIAVDISGNVYITGAASSDDLPDFVFFPTTDGAFQTTSDDTICEDVFVTKINSYGTNLIYSTLLGGDHCDHAYGISVDEFGYVYVAGETYSSNPSFPTTSGVYQPDHHQSSWDGFIGKFNPTGSDLEYLTYLGGDLTDRLYGLAVNEFGEVYVVGYSNSENYPKNPSAFQQALAGEYDVVVTALNSAATDLIYSTYLGGTERDYGYELVLDQNGEVVIVGETFSNNFPPEVPYQTEFGGDRDAFITRLNQNGEQLVFSTYLGGIDRDWSSGVTLDGQGNIWVSGTTESSNFPKPANVFLSGERDVFLTGFSPLGDELIYSSLLGGSGLESWFIPGTDIAYWEGTITVSGTSSSSDFPTTPGVYQEVIVNVSDGFVTRFYLSETVVPDEVTYSDACLSDECPIATTTNGSTDEHAGDPINTRTGAWSYTNSDISVPVLGGNLTFTRFYNSLAADQYSDPLGYGWTHNHDLHLTFITDPGQQESTVVFKGPSANQYTFVDHGNGVYQPYPGVLATLEQNPGPPVTYTLVDSAQNVYQFDDNGLIEKRTDANGVELSYSYNPDGKLDTVVDSTGLRYFEFSYTTTAPERIESVTAHTGVEQRVVSFGYDGAGDLTSYTDLMGETWTYGYNANHQVTDLYAPSQSGSQLFLHTDYDPEGRAYQQFDGDLNELAYIIYNPDGTSISEDPYDNQTVHAYDSRNTLSESSTPLGVGTNTEYDYNFRPAEISYAGEQGNFMAMHWSEDGANLEYIRDAVNNETLLNYDDLNNITSVVDPNLHPTKYYYDDPNFPTQVTKIEYPISYGGENWVTTEYTYYQPDNPEGQPAGEIRTVTNNGLRTYYEYNQFGQVTLLKERDNTDFPLDTEYIYDDFGRLVETRSPDGVRTRTEYDAAAKITRVIENCWYEEGVYEYPNSCITSTHTKNYQDSEGVFYNLVTTYEYDLRGNRIAVTDTLGNITRTYYDSFDRVTTVVRNWDGVDIYDETPPDRTESTPVSNLHTDYVYDENGRQIAVVDQAEITNRTYYDEDGRTSAVVQNLVGQTIADPALPVFDSGYPDQNILTQYYYDSRGNLIATSDVDGRITRTYYDDANRPYVVVQNWAGTIQDLLNNPDSDPPIRESSTVETNLFTETVYDPNGNVVATMDPAGNITRTYYDSLNRPYSVVQNYIGTLEGIKTELEIDPDADPPDRNTSTSDQNIRTDTVYDENGRAVATVDPRGFVTKRVYNELGQLDQVIINESTNPDPNEYNITTSYTYDEFGRQVETIFPDGMITRTEYDASGRVVSVTQNCKFSYPSDCITAEFPQNYMNEFNLVTSYTYDALGRRVTNTDTLGHVTENEYDAVGRVNQVNQNKHPTETDPYFGQEYNIITEYTYDVAGNQIAVTAPPTIDPQGTITRTYFDDLNRPIIVFQNWDDEDLFPVTLPERGSNLVNLRTDTIYLGNGNVDRVIDELGLQTVFVYDLLGRRTSVTDPHLPSNPLPGATEFSYDISGNQVLVTDAKGVDTKYDYDLLGRLTTVTENYIESDPEPVYTVDINVRTIYTYDIMGNLKSIRDGNSNLDDIPYFTTFEYNALNRLKSETDPLMHTWVYTYDAVGNKRSMLDANGITTYYDYDSLNRLTEIDYPGTNMDVTFSYDPLGRRTDMMTVGVGNTHWEHDGLGRVETVTDPFSQVVGYEYDPLGSRTQITYPDTKTVDYKYDALGRLDYLTDWQSNITSYTFDAASRLTGVSLPNGVDSTYDYDDANHLTGITHDDGVDTLSSFGYTTDAVGNRTDAVEFLVGSSGTASMAPDSRSEMVMVGSPAVGLETSIRNTSVTNNPLQLASLEIPVISEIVGVEADTDTTEVAVLVLKIEDDELLKPHLAFTEVAIEPEIPSPETSEVVIQPDVIQAGALVVDSARDTSDVDPGDGVCVDGYGSCTLRAAIEEANATHSVDTIAFEINGEGPYIIQPKSPLPEITAPVVINGATQRGYAGSPVIVLDGAKAGDWANGLMLKADEVSVRGLGIINFTRSGLYVLGDNNTIQANYLGVEADGKSASGNEIGILIEDASGTQIGGDARTDSNLISGNQFGVYIYGDGATKNLIQSNRIGTDSSGQAALGNEVGVRINEAFENQIGTNLISGNQTGIMIQGKNASGNQVYSNRIGLDDTGDNVLGNDEVGIWILDAPGNTIGGVDSADGNRILGSGHAILVQGLDVIDNLFENNEVEDLLPTEAELSAERIMSASNAEDDSPVVPPDAEKPQEDLNSPPLDDNVTESTNLLDFGYIMTSAPTTYQSEIIMTSYHLPQPILNGGLYAPLATGATFVVNSIGDGNDSNPGDGVCANPGGYCTLRAAIQEANALVGTDTINFNIPNTGLHTIQPASPLPTISEAVVIDGSTQTGYSPTTPMIELDGTNAGVGAIGLKITAGNSTIHGLVINRFDNSGIEIRTTGGNTVVGNFIGTDPTGTSALPNLAGIKILGTANDIIGWISAVDRNLISGNSFDGIYLTDQASDTLIQGNYIGTNVDGNTPLPNGGDGIDAQNVSDITIGGTDTDAGNLISGNLGYGIRFNNGNSGAVIQGNLIGTNSDGTIAVPNSTIGIGIRNAANTTIGGTIPEARNLISGNIFAGIYLGEGAVSTLIQSNYIGTDSTGMLALPNSGGVEVHDATNTTIGGIDPGVGNLISGNSLFGIKINAGADNTLIQGNTVGADAVGTGSVPNDNGVKLLNSTNITIGGTSTDARNLISGNTYDGVIVSGGASGVLIQGNYIGTDIDGMQALPNQDDGVDIEESTGTTVGGSAPGAGNLISGNGNHGIEVYDSTTPPTGVIIQGNKIGINSTGSTGIPNAGYGIIVDGVTGTSIGGIDPGAGNTVAFNGFDGIAVVNASSGITLSSNSIFENSALGIDLGYDGVTANDDDDPDTGPNDLQNYPVITSASSDGVNTSEIAGTLNSTASTTFQLGFFASATCDVEGNGEGEIYLGNHPVTTDTNGDVSFTANLTTGVPDGYVVTGTATDPAGSTSEFSACEEAVVTSPPTDLNYEWHYDYDPLYRLTYACTEWDAVNEMCLGDEFSYTYDAVGNRKSQTVRGVTTTYEYDEANRLTSVDGVTYTWDNNGNLLNDGVNTYTYDYTNRLVGLTDGVNTYSYVYNGLGNRLQQTVNGETTTYTLDLNAGLTQVLGDGTVWYLYGAGRVGEYGTGWEYYLTGALGSVRQLVDSIGVVIMAQSYEPFGDVMESYGVGESSYGFTGEQTDATGLQYLRARYYNTGVGRFISRDPSNLEANLFTYASSNPINKTDPSGLLSTNLDGPAAFSICIGLHSVLPFAQNVEGVNINLITVRQAIDICKAAYSQNLWNKNWFDLTGEGGLPTSGHNLFGWYLFETGTKDHLIFHADDILTQELINSKSIDTLRHKYFFSGASLPQGDVELEYDITEQAQCLLTRYYMPSRIHTGFPLACVMGSYNYQIVSLNDGWYGFRIDNRTDLASGTHFAGRHGSSGYAGSIEELLLSGEIRENELLYNVYSSKPVISILDDMGRKETNSYTGLFGNEHDLGGGNLTQTYVWKERPCHVSYWFLGNMIYSDINYAVEKWDTYEGYTYLPSKLAP